MADPCDATTVLTLQPKGDPFAQHVDQCQPLLREFRAVDAQSGFGVVRRGARVEVEGADEQALPVDHHGLRHEALIEEYIAITGQEPPLRGGGEGLTRDQEDAARWR